MAKVNSSSKRSFSYIVSGAPIRPIRHLWRLVEILSGSNKIPSIEEFVRSVSSLWRRLVEDGAADFFGPIV